MTEIWKTELDKKNKKKLKDMELGILKKNFRRGSAISAYLPAGYPPVSPAVYTR